MRFHKVLFSLLTALALAFSPVSETVLSPFQACTASADSIATGGCGENLLWTFYDGVLTIKGSGSMTDYFSVIAPAPWHSMRNSITTLVISKGVTKIGWNAFEDCTNLKTAIIPEGITSIPIMAFWECSSLTDISLPSTLTDIGAGAFWGCISLSALNIPPLVNRIGEGAFENTQWLANQSDGMVYAGNTLYSYKGSIEESTFIMLAPWTTGIAECAFRNHSGLSSILIPEGVECIGKLAFGGCTSLKSVKLPRTLETVTTESFKGCTSLEEISIPDALLIEWNAFDGCDALKNLTVGSSTVIEELAYGYSYNSLDGTYKKYDNRSVTGYSGTYAEKYAADNGFEFISLGTAVKGDIDGDNVRTLFDCVLLNHFLLGVGSLSPQQIIRADINDDGHINIFDFITFKSLLIYG